MRGASFGSSGARGMIVWSAKMLRGTCKLCRKDAELQRSHLLGKAIYKLCREDDGKNPIVMTTDVVMPTSWQVRDHLLCSDCEERFNKGGERYITSLVWRRQNGFPLLNRLRVALPMQIRSDHTTFSGTQVGIDTDKLAYYALSVIWRSGVHQWKTIGDQTTSVMLGTEDEESIRKYLLGETALPVNVNVVVNVCTDLASQVLVLFPWRLGELANCSVYPLLVRGIDFNVLIGNIPNASFVEVCCVRSAGKRIFVSDKTEVRLNGVKHFFERSKLARNVQIPSVA